MAFPLYGIPSQINCIFHSAYLLCLCYGSFSNSLFLHRNTPEHYCTSAQSPSAQHLLSAEVRIVPGSDLSAGQVRNWSASVSPEGYWAVVSLSVTSILAPTLTSCYWCLTCSLNSPASSGLIHFLFAPQAASLHAAHTCWRFLLHEKHHWSGHSDSHISSTSVTSGCPHFVVMLN